MKTQAAFPRFQEILAAICTGRSINEILQLVLDQACELVKAHHGSLMRIDKESDTLAILGTVGADWSMEKKGERLKIGQGVTGTVAQTGKPYWCADTDKDTHYVALFPSIKSEIAVPVVIDGAVWAVINMDSEEYGAFGENAAQLLSAYAEMVSFSIQAHLARDWFGEKNLEVLMAQLESKVPEV